ncbi:MAG: hypothetical protein GX038_01210 [Erysipelothrix sp.]|nr:hypothetical protein [Erysipelothrix sp.]
MIENFDDFMSLASMVGAILFVIYISFKLIRSSKKDDDETFYKEIL